MIFEMFDPASLRLRSRDQIAVKDKWWKKSYMKLRTSHPEKTVVVLSPEFMSWATQLYSNIRARFHRLELGSYTGEKPMSGYYAILWALQVRPHSCGCTRNFRWNCEIEIFALIMDTGEAGLSALCKERCRFQGLLIDCASKRQSVDGWSMPIVDLSAL